jgi:hypothetical protein
MKNLLSMIALCFFLTGNIAEGQIDKTQLSLDASKKQEQNIKILSQFTWKRKIEASSEGNVVMTSLSSVTMGTNGKPVYQVIDQESAVKKGSKKQAEAREYIKNAVDLASRYIFMSTGQMVDLFNKGTLSVISNDLRAEAFNLLNQGDRVNFTFDKTSLDYKSQDISTIMNGDAVKAKVSYKMVNGVNTVDKVTLDLPAKKISVILTNFEYAQKL